MTSSYHTTPRPEFKIVFKRSKKKTSIRVVLFSRVINVKYTAKIKKSI